MFSISLHLETSSAQCWYQKGKLCKTIGLVLIIRYLFTISSSTAPEKPLVHSLNCGEKGFNGREKYRDNAVSKAACFYLPLWCGKPGDLAICSPPSPICCWRAVLVGSSAGRISCVFIGSIASGAAVDRNYSIHSVLVRLRAAVAVRADLSIVSRRGCKAGL